LIEKNRFGSAKADTRQVSALFLLKIKKSTVKNQSWG
jgi:hypothetical protein